MNLLGQVPRVCRGALCASLVFSAAALRLVAAPPTVVNITPAPGEKDVDPALTEMRIEFDADMSGGQSVCGGGPTFPVAGGGRWIDRRTFVSPLKLAPGHEYQLSLNCPSSNRSFRSLAGERLAMLPVSFRTRAAGEPAPQHLTEADTRPAIDALRKAIDEHYSYRDRLQLDWDQVFEQYQPRLLAAQSPARFAFAASRLLVHARDEHVWLAVNDSSAPTYSLVPTYSADVAANFKFAVLPNLIKNWQKRNEFVYSGRAADNVGYLLITSFGGDEPLIVQPALAALDDLADTKALIIDVRPNGGGSEPLARLIAGCFLEAETAYAQHKLCEPAQLSGWSGTNVRHVSPTPGHARYRGRVAVLMGPRSMSSCESFLLMMRQVPGCQLIGERSRGSSGNPQPYELGMGVKVFLPLWRDELLDGTLLEGRGIDPDVRAPIGPDDFRTTDPVLSAALEKLR